MYTELINLDPSMYCELLASFHPSIAPVQVPLLLTTRFDSSRTNVWSPNTVAKDILVLQGMVNACDRVDGDWGDEPATVASKEHMHVEYIDYIE
jgi:hypothetical protein